MAQQEINLGAAANDGTGDTLRAAGEKINENFTETYGRLVGVHGLLPVAAGGYVPFALNAQTFTTAAITADRLYATPLVFARSFTLDQLSGYIGTGAASAKARFGLYADNGSGRPGARLADGGEMATTATGAISGSITPVEVEAGVLYWAVAQTGGGNATFRVAQTAGLLLAESPDGSGNSPSGALVAVVTYAALPATAPAFTTGAVNFPFMRGRVA